MALALHPLGADDRAGLGGDLAGPVGAVIVVDVDGGAGQRGAEGGDGLGDRRFLIVAGQQDGDAVRRGRPARLRETLLVAGDGHAALSNGQRLVCL